MWLMVVDMIECDECVGVLASPPKFTIPPPPRPSYMSEYSLTKCNEEDKSLKTQQAWENDICEAMPIFDARLYSSQSWQTLTIIAVFTLLLFLVILISSLYVWKNKRKVQNFLTCKTPNRGLHINGDLPLGSNHAFTYEEPYVLLEHYRPLVILHHHHNVEMLHGKGIHYPSSYPMTRSPPFLVSPSPEPATDRSNDNVYEELDTGRDSDAESDPQLHSDDNFAEDELSLPGERFFKKLNEIPNAVVKTNISSIYHERISAVSNMCASPSNAFSSERNSVHSISSTSTQDASTTTIAPTTAFQNNNQINNNINHCGSTTARSSAGSFIPGIFRHTIGRNKLLSSNARARNAASVENFNAASSTTDANDINVLQRIYDTRSTLMSLAYIPQQHLHQHNQVSNNGNSRSFHNLYQLKNSNKNKTGHSSNRLTSVQFYNTLDNEVERRNLMNAQLTTTLPVPTIYSKRKNYPIDRSFNCSNTSNSESGIIANSIRERTVSRSMNQRHRDAEAANPIEPRYAYAEPIYYDNRRNDTCGSPAINTGLVQFPNSAYLSKQLMHAYTTEGTAYQDHLNHNQQQTPKCQGNSQLYSCADSSFESDSGYSQHTPASSIGQHDYDTALPAQPDVLTKTGVKETRKPLGITFYASRASAKESSNASNQKNKNFLDQAQT